MTGPPASAQAGPPSSAFNAGNLDNNGGGEMGSRPRDDDAHMEHPEYADTSDLGPWMGRTAQFDERSADRKLSNSSKLVRH